VPSIRAALLALLALTPAVAAAGTVDLSFVFDLATVNGRLPSSWARLSYDREHQEVFVLHAGVVRVFNQAGMEIHRFGDDGDLGGIEAVAPLDSGEILVLSNVDGHRKILRCNFRGERVGELKLSGLPPAVEAAFEPETMVHQGRTLYLWDARHRTAVALDEDGRFLREYRLDELVKTDPRKRADSAVFGFGVDADGDLLFTMPMIFTAFVISPSGEVRSFGKRGSAPGRFNVVGAITSDEKGNLFLTDRLRCVVMIFDRSFQFLGEFGYRGEDDGELIMPSDLVVANDLVFVAQAAERGVRVYRVKWAEPVGPATK